MPIVLRGTRDGKPSTITIPDGVSEGEGIAEAMSQGWKPAPPASGMEGVSGALAGARGSTQEAINSFLRTLVEPRLPAPTEQPMPGGPFESPTADIAAGLLNPVPGSVPEATALGAAAATPFIQGAGRGAGGATPSLGARMGQAGVRAAVPGVAMTGAALAEGEDLESAMLRGALTALAVGGVEGAVGAAKMGRKTLTNLYGRERLIQADQQTAMKVVEAIQQDVPAIAHLLNPDKPESLNRMVARAPGKGEGETLAHQALRSVYDASDRAAQQYFGDTNLAPHLPALVRFAVEAKGIKIPKGQVPDLRITEAQQLLKEMKGLQRMALAGREPSVKFDPIQAARRAEEQYKAVLTPDLRNTYEDAVTQFSKGLSLVEAVQEWSKQGILEGTERGIVTRTPELGAYLLANQEKLGDRVYPAIYGSIFGRGMATPTELTMGGAVPQRAGGRLPYGGFVTGKIPEYMRRPPPTGPEAPVPTDLSRGLMDALAILATRPGREGVQPPLDVGRIPQGGR